MYVLTWRTFYVLTRGLFWCLFPELCSNEGNKHQNNTRVSAAHKQFVTRVHTLFYFLHDITNPWITLKQGSSLRSSVCLTRLLYVLLMTPQSMEDDVTMTTQLWRDNVTSDMWLVRYRFYGGSCKKISNRMLQKDQPIFFTYFLLFYVYEFAYVYV